MRLAGEAENGLVLQWAIAMIGTALDSGISERQIRRVLDPQIMPELIREARETLAAAQGLVSEKE